MNLKDIEYFVALSDKGSFIKAAAQCNTSQPTISNSINRMEKELGTSLFKRTTRSLSLTPKGVEILGCAHAILTSVNLMKEIANGNHELDKGINLGLTTSLSQYLYSSIVESASGFSTHPVKVHEIRKEKIKIKLDSGLIHCLLIACDENLHHYDKLLVAQFPYVLAVSSDDELAGLNAIKLSEIKGRALLGLQDDSSNESSHNTILERNNINYERGLLFCTTEVLKMAIVQKKGIGLIPAYAANVDNGIKYIHLDTTELESKVHLIYRKNDVNKGRYVELAARIGGVINSHKYVY